MTQRPTPPLWFLILFAVASSLALRALDQAFAGAGGGAATNHEPQLAFWGFIVAVAGAIFKGLSVAAKVTLTALSWSVKALWLFATTTANGLKALGQLLATGIKGVWKFFDSVFERVIKPGWLKFWRWFDKFRRWLDDTFAPVFKWLRRLRDNLLLFYQTYIRPWLDLIDVTRRLLRVLGSLGIEWARALDRKLAELEEKIEKPFRLVLAELNKVINIVNRIVTADGLFQRLTLVRSIARDYSQIWNSLTNLRSKPLTASERADMRKQLKGRPLAEIVAEKEAYFVTGGGPSEPLIAELTRVASAALDR